MAEREEERIRKYPLLPRDPNQGWTPYVWLIYLFEFVLSPLFSDQAARLWLPTLLATLIFLPLYFLGYWVRGRRLLGIIAAIFVLGSVCSPWNYGASVFFIYAAAFAGKVGDIGLGVRLLGGLLLLLGLESWVLQFSPVVWAPALGFSLLTGAVTIFHEQRRQMMRKLQMAQSDVERMAKIAERERIARDLHDLLGHTLSLIVLKSELASKLTERDPARASQEIRDVERISREALAEVRAAVRGFRSAGLASELDHTRETLETAGIAFDSAMETVNLSATEESALALVVREAVTNIVRHSSATTCRLRFQSHPTFCELQIADNGRGGASAEGFGLKGMRERVEALGGTLERNSTDGTRLTIRLPRGSAIQQVSGVA